MSSTRSTLETSDYSTVHFAALVSNVPSELHLVQGAFWTIDQLMQQQPIYGQRCAPQTNKLGHALPPDLMQKPTDSFMGFCSSVNEPEKAKEAMSHALKLHVLDIHARRLHHLGIRHALIA